MPSEKRAYCQLAQSSVSSRFYYKNLIASTSSAPNSFKADGLDLVVRTASWQSRHQLAVFSVNFSSLLHRDAMSNAEAIKIHQKADILDNLSLLPVGNSANWHSFFFGLTLFFFLVAA